MLIGQFKYLLLTEHASEDISKWASSRASLLFINTLFTAPIVLPSLVGIREYLVSVGYIMEHFLSIVITLVLVRMILEG